ncbi:MAG: hypothetical protein CML61_02310 [Rhodobacteraceae bacterium]|nr:hypothetical protein [Paracoccaceae bacterium]
MTADPAIAIAPYGTRFGKTLAQLPLDDLHWPLGRPPRLAQGRVADMARFDHLICYPKTNMHFLPRLGSPAQISVMVVEPSIIHARHLRYLRWTHRRFFRVFSYNDALLGAIPNGLLLPFGTTWVAEPDRVDTTKSRRMSLIASAKRDHVGHRLRHDIVTRIQSEQLDVDVLGRGYAPFDSKADGLAPYRFSVIIENVRERNYFTEKLVDAILCETVPIYWGCPNIGDFIDPACMIQCDSEAEVLAAIRDADEVTFDRHIGPLRAARGAALHWANLELRAATALRDRL